jgi:hypothetical protein
MQTRSTDLNVLLARLMKVGEKPPRKLFNEILEHGQDAVEPLIGLVTDYQGYGPEEDSRSFWATYHAIRLLGELRAAEAVGPIMALLDEDDDYVAEYLPESLARIGEPAIEPLREALFAPDADVYGLARAANALTKMAELYPEYRTDVLGMIRERLDADIPNDDPYTLRGFLISDLANARAVEAVSSIRRAFEEDLVDESVIDLETVEALVGRPEGMSPREALTPLFRRYEARMVSNDAAPGVGAALADPLTGSRRPMPFGRKVGRNEACPCGSTKKYKRCHGR